MDFTECDHDDIVDGVCADCYEVVCAFFQDDSNDLMKKKIMRRSMKTVTNSFIAGVIKIIDHAVSGEIMAKVKVAIEDNIIQIRDQKTAKKVVFAYIYSEMYSRDLPPEKLFETTPDRLIAIMGLTKKDATKSLNYINSSKIRGPSYVIIHPYIYMMEFRREVPDSPVARLITDSLLSHIKKSIDFEVNVESRENPVKCAISYMGLLSEKILKPERGSIKPIQDMYDFYGLELSQVKDTLPVIKRFFARDFV